MRHVSSAENPFRFRSGQSCLQQWPRPPRHRYHHLLPLRMAGSSRVTPTQRKTKMTTRNTTTARHTPPRNSTTLRPRRRPRDTIQARPGRPHPPIDPRLASFICLRFCVSVVWSVLFGIIAVGLYIAHCACVGADDTSTSTYTEHVQLPAAGPPAHAARPPYRCVFCSRNRPATGCRNAACGACCNRGGAYCARHNY